MEKVVIDGDALNIDDVVSVARFDARVVISKKAKNKVRKARDTLDHLLKEKKPIYGVTTGFGALGNVPIAPKDFKKLQVNLIRSHSSGVGKPLSRDIIRALMLLRANTLAKGYSGVRLTTLETLVKMINKRVHPIVPEKGSVGASGDLTPLSHMVLVMIGEGEAEFQGITMSGKEAMEKSNISPVVLDVKEGVALNNGTQMMTAIAALLVYDAENLVKTAEVAASLSLEALCGITEAFDDRIHRVKPHRGQMESARNVLTLLSGSKLVKANVKIGKGNKYPQDPYSLRCIPQVLGSVRDIAKYVKSIVNIEINSATDNPLVFAEDGVCLSGGNFHGQYISAAMDYLAIALATIGNLSERRIARLIDESLSQGLPPFLISKKAKSGVQSGFMTLQYTAAALASENKSLSHPASVDSIPTSANFEDFVSMGPFAATKALEILSNVQYIVAIELLSAAQGVEFRGVQSLGKGTRQAYDIIRSKISTLKEDRAVSRDIEIMKGMIGNCELGDVGVNKGGLLS
ncbi:MAG: histidine ammonia-lyase [Candidatus Bathyarchaeota archaeon]|nr:MAG: histidine ammonia-lyase [Candidatus Bathyarchaeota archaeon]